MSEDNHPVIDIMNHRPPAGMRQHLPPFEEWKEQVLRRQLCMEEAAGVSAIALHYFPMVVSAAIPAWGLDETAFRVDDALRELERCEKTEAVKHAISILTAAKEKGADYAIITT